MSNIAGTWRWKDNFISGGTLIHDPYTTMVFYIDGVEYTYIDIIEQNALFKLVYGHDYNGNSVIAASGPSFYELYWTDDKYKTITLSESSDPQLEYTANFYAFLSQNAERQYPIKLVYSAEIENPRIIPLDESVIKATLNCAKHALASDLIIEAQVPFEITYNNITNYYESGLVRLLCAEQLMLTDIIITPRNVINFTYGMSTNGTCRNGTTWAEYAETAEAELAFLTINAMGYACQYDTVLYLNGVAQSADMYIKDKKTYVF